MKGAGYFVQWSMSFFETKKNFLRQYIPTKRQPVKVSMEVFNSRPHSVQLADGSEKNLAKLNLGDEVLGYDEETKTFEKNEVTGIELLEPMKFYYLVNGKYAFHKNQSVVINGKAIHVFKLDVGDEMMRADGTSETIKEVRLIKTPYVFIKLSVGGSHTYFLNGILVHNASRYWVGGTASWDGTAGTKWASSSGGAGGSSVPTTSDDVFFDANSNTGASITASVASGNTGCLSLDFTGFTRIFGGNSPLTIAGSLTLSTGMTRNYIGTITFSSTATGRTLTFNGKTMANGLTFDGVGGGWTFQDTLTNSTASAITLTNGTLDTNGQTVTCGSFQSNNSNTRTLTLGASTINLRNPSSLIWDTTTTTNFTFNVGTSTINISGTYASTGTCVLAHNNLNFYNFEVNTFAGPFVLTTDLVVTNDLKLAGTSVSSRLVLMSLTAGTQRTVTANALSSFQNVDLLDIAGAGSASWTGTSIGNGGNNSGITFTTAVTRYRVGGSGNYSNAAATWASSSGGSAGASMPICHDTVVIDANSFSAGSQTMTLDLIGILPTLDFTNVTNNPTLTYNQMCLFSGDLIIKSGMSFTTGSSRDLVFVGPTAATLTTNGVAVGNGTIAAFRNRKSSGVNLTLGSDLTLATNVIFALSSGDFDLNGFDFIAGSMTLSSGISNWGSGNVQFDFNGGILFLSNTATTTVYSGDVRATFGAGYIDVNGVTANTRTISGYGPSLKISAGTGGITISSAPNFDDIDFTGYTGNANFSANVTIRGSLTLDSGMTVTGGGNTVSFTSTGAETIDTNGVTFDRPLTFNGVGGYWQLLDDLTTSSARQCLLTNGHIDLNNFDLTVGLFSSSNSNVRELSFGSGNLYIKGTGTVFDFNVSTNATINKGTGSVIIDDASATAKTIRPGGLSFYRLYLTGAGTGVFTFSSNINLDVFEVDTPPHTITINANNTLTVNSAAGWKVRGTSGNLITLQSSSGVNHNISIPSGIVVSDYLSISDSNATGGATFYAGPNSTDAGGANTGWIFTSPVATFSEIVTIADAIATQITGGSSISLPLAEVVTIVDAISRQAGKSLVEAVVIVDTILRAPGRVFIEAVTVVDTFLRSLSRLLTETVILVDTILIVGPAIQLALTEVVTIADTFTRQIGKVFVEAVSIVDNVRRTLNRAFVEAVIIVDVISKSLLRRFTESVTVVDVINNVKTAFVRATGYIRGITKSTNTKRGTKR